RGRGGIPAFSSTANCRRAWNDRAPGIAHAGGSGTTRRPHRRARQGTPAALRHAIRSESGGGRGDTREFAGNSGKPSCGFQLVSERSQLRGTLRKMSALFQRDLAIARSYRAAFVLELLETLFASAGF